MPVRWVLFDLTGTLVDPSVLAQPLGDSGAAEELVGAALDDAAAQAMTATLTGVQVDFSVLLGAALRRALALAGKDAAAADDAVELLAAMPAFLEAPQALERLRGEGLHLGVLTQSTTAGAERVLRFAGLRDRLDVVVGADAAGAFKPDPRPYRAALERTGATAEETCHVTAHWWDVAGAHHAGLRTAWVARRERLLVGTVPAPDVTGRDLAEVAEAIVERLV
jgi:2-haloacid dehalogenase